MGRFGLPLGADIRLQRARQVMKSALFLGGLTLLVWMVGCSDPKAKFGRTWYIDGAGNWGFGVLEVPEGLADAGYKGAVTNHRWSLTLNPALDQTLRFIARGSGDLLGSEITSYLRNNPGADANVIALSAGTGVGVWAIESVKPPYKVNNFVLVGSSLSNKYDVRKALGNMKGKIYVYHSNSDPVLDGPVRALGTIDGSFDDAAGLVGLRGPGSETGRVVNIPWSSKFASLGWTGGHTDCTNRRFVGKEIAYRIDESLRGGRASPSPAGSPRMANAPAPPPRTEAGVEAIAH